MPDARIDIELLDFPGGWIKPKDRVGVEDQWEKCRKFIAASTILLVPVDASLLMETTEKEHLRLLPQFLTTVQVEQVARDWAIERNRRPEEPALVAFCPVKGEAYFNDNGGIKNRSVLLRQRFDTVYAGVVQAVRAEAPKATILYAPVDTIGCVELVRADWTKSSTGIWGFDAKYRVRGKAEISRMGVDDLMTAIAQQLIYGKRWPVPRRVTTCAPSRTGQRSTRSAARLLPRHLVVGQPGAPGTTHGRRTARQGGARGAASGAGTGRGSGEDRSPALRPAGEQTLRGAPMHVHLRTRGTDIDYRFIGDTPKAFWWSEYKRRGLTDHENR